LIEDAMTFADNLKTLPSIDALAALELLDAQGQVLASIENKPGKAGSLAVYAYLARKHGGINAQAAREGLALFAEHTADAQANPGKHPNIDRLQNVLDRGQTMAVRLLTNNAK
jgi:hypothetical protein